MAKNFGILPKTLYNWYRNYLSDYKSDIASGRWHPKYLYELVDEETGEIFSKQPLYVFKPENIGEFMNIDDKSIAHEGFTILSNTQTGAMAMMIESTNGKDVEAALGLFGKVLERIKSISCDMSATYLKACRLLLPLAQIVIDKFHVMQYVYGAIEEVRLRIKKEQTAQLSKGKTKTEKDKEILTDLEQLRHCGHRLSQSPEKWSEKGQECVLYVFRKYPELKVAYDIGQKFKKWYDIGNSKKPKVYIERDLRNWYYMVEDSKIEEFMSVVKMVEKHETQIVNFFERGHSNAKAERLNGKIQRFVSNNYGMRDRDFALFRMANYFS